jgi:hypothetical protein
MNPATRAKKNIMNYFQRIIRCIKTCSTVNIWYPFQDAASIVFFQPNSEITGKYEYAYGRRLLASCTGGRRTAAAAGAATRSARWGPARRPAHAETRQEFVRFFRTALFAGDFGVRPEHELLEVNTAGVTMIFVDRHIAPFRLRRKVKLQISSIKSQINSNHKKTSSKQFRTWNLIIGYDHYSEPFCHSRNPLSRIQVFQIMFVIQDLELSSVISSPVSSSPQETFQSRCP